MFSSLSGGPQATCLVWAARLLILRIMVQIQSRKSRNGSQARSEFIDSSDDVITLALMLV